MTEEKLRNCPFCGGEPTIVVRKGKDGWRDRYSILCDYEHGGCGAESGWYHYESEAVEAWNKRVGDANKTITCFKCHGAGVFGVPYLDDNGEWDGRFDVRKCDVCGHTGKITLALYERWQKRMREE